MKTFGAILFFCSAFISCFSQSSNAQIDAYITKKVAYHKSEFNKTKKKGFAILLYSGEEQEALKFLNKYKELYNTEDIHLDYNTPNWIVQTKSFKTKIEAERFLLKIKDDFKNAKVY